VAKGHGRSGQIRRQSSPFQGKPLWSAARAIAAREHDLNW
jgi:hypothetical protein